uniref:Serine/threonine-protein phosphatase n=1 Tax=Trichobilharzia regenti TaxID=157069 RepID=A0AA85JMI1_TRIRE|nr:unnamed protein product [Trichobilharzia regenti]
MLKCVIRKMFAAKANSLESNPKLSLHAAVIIQCWYRKCKARLDVRRKCAWQVNQSLEYVMDTDDSEGLQLILSNFGDTEDVSESNKSLLNRQISFAADFNSDLNSLEPPISEENFLSFLAWIKSDKKIPVKFVVLILTKATEFLPAVKIFEETGLPNYHNRIIFNGDFVDRGAKSVEVISLLLMALLTYPNDIFLNRGNHEDIKMNERYGFVKELSNKYPKDKKNLIHVFDELFRALPIGAIINNTILICHGGISKHTDIRKLRTLNRFKLSSILQPCLDGDDCVNLDDWQQALDLLWSDPQDKDGCRPNCFRGAGCYFGSDVTKKFLETTNLSMIIRSHECCIEGWRTCHSGKVLTLFSSFDYFALRSNKGAYARITVVDSSQTFLTDLKAVISLCPTNNLSKNQQSVPVDIYVNVFIIDDSESHLSNNSKKSDDLVNTSFICLWQRIIRWKEKLMERFSEVDLENSGVIPLAEWCNIMSSVTQLKLSWRCLRSFLVKQSANCVNKVIYKSMFAGNCVTHPELSGEHLLANDIFEVQSQLLAITQACHFENNNVDLYKLLGKLESASHNERINRIKGILSRLMDFLHNRNFKSFNLEIFLASFRFVEIQKRIKTN